MADNKLVSSAWTSYNQSVQDNRESGHNSDSANLNFSTSVSEVMDELAELLIQKHHDYGPKNISASPGGPLNGLRVRLHDKLARLVNLTDEAREPKYESLEDTLMDMANYAVIGLLVLRGKWDS